VRSCPRLECSPPLAFGLGTGSPIFSGEKIGSAVQLLDKTAKQKKDTFKVFFFCFVPL
jgi:hypothetical protein